MIVGADIYGVTFGCMAHRQGKRSLVIDKRNHFGGNTYCENIEGVNVHNLILGGHLAEYKYYDMAPIVEKVMGLFGE